MKVLIIEDEPLAVAKLKKHLKRYDASMHLLQDIDSVEYAVKYLQGNPQPDLIIVDIQLADGLSFEIFKQVQIASPLIFVTAYDNYALQAFKQNSIDYILKPYEYEDVHRAMDKFKSMHQSKQQASIDIGALELAMQTLANKYKKRFVVKAGEKLLSIETSSIQAFLSEDKYTMLVDQQGKKHFVQFRLDQLTEILNPESFYRINRKFIVNVSAIREMIAYSGSRLKVHLNAYEHDDLIVSREKVSGFKQWLGA